MAEAGAIVTARRAGTRRMLSLLFFLLLPAAMHCAHAAALHVETADTLVRTGTGTGYAQPPYRIAPQGPDGAWRKVGLPDTVTRPIAGAGGLDRQPGATILTWYRVDAPLPASPSSAPRFLYVPRWKTDGRLAVYGDGRLLYSSQGGINWNGWNLPLWIALDGGADQPAPATIVLRIEHPRHTGGGISTLWIGSADDIAWRYRLRSFLQAQLPAASSFAFLAVGLFSLFVWIRSLSERLYGLFFCIALASFLRTIHYYVGEQPLMVDETWFTWLTVNSLYWMVLIMHVFLNHLHHQVQRWLDRSVIALVCVVGLATMPGAIPHLDVYSLAPLAYAIVLVAGIGLAVLGLLKSRRAHSLNGTLLSAWGLLAMVLGLVDWLLQINVLDPELIYLGPYTNLGAFLVFMQIVYHRYLEAHDAVRRANAGLQQQLTAREDELDQSYRRLRVIEERQTRSEERQRLMQDMHDGMGSSLVSALMAVESGPVDNAVVADILRACIDDLRLTIDSMEPVQEDLLLLLATLRFRIGQRLEHAGVQLRWQVATVPPLEWLDPRSSLHVLRILQEAFTNIVKHARATEIRVSTVVEGDHVLVCIQDNGIGFVPDSRASEGKGLNNQLRRAAAIGAELSWKTDGGTTLTMRLPIQKEHQGKRH